MKKNENVAMEAFVQEPGAYVKKQQLLRIIFNLTEYQELKRELEKRKIILEAIAKLHQEGVLSLEQWRDYEQKDTVTPLARGKLNAALTQILTERLKRTQEMKFTISPNIEDVLFKGRARVNEMRLNDFLTREPDGRGVVATNRSVLLKEFFKDPTKYIRDKGALNEIQITDAYARMEKAVREEMDLEEVVSKLSDKGVSNLLGWSEAAASVKKTVHKLTKQSLDAALQEARNRMTTIEVMKMEGLYESVYNASWHHVVEIPDGDKRKKTGTGLKVEKGKPKQSWTYKKDGNTFEKDDAVRKSGEAPPLLMVLTSDKGWPYTLNVLHGAGNDLCVNCEVERVWQIVKRDLTKWFSNFDLTLNPSPLPRVLIGTPGIGKSMNAGSYLLYQLLHCDVEKLQMVFYCFGGGDAYVFDKTTKTVTKYVGNEISIVVLCGLRQCGMKGYVIYDVAKKGTPPPGHFAPTSGWGMIVVSSPNVDNYDGWEKQLKAARIIMNCLAEMDVKAMCAWINRDGTKEKQAEYWKMVKERMEKVGPIPRYIFDANGFIEHSAAVEDALEGIKSRDGEKHFTHGGVKLWYSGDPPQKVVSVVRARGEVGAGVFLNAPICADIGFRIADRLAKTIGAKDLLLLILRSHGVLASKYVEQLGLRVFMHEELVSALVKELKELPPPSPSEPQDSVLKLNHQGYPTRTVGLRELQDGVERIPMEYRVLYIPKVEKFPLVDGFFFVDSPRRTLVGLQMNTAGAHHTITSTVRLFNERLAEYFKGWEEFAQYMSWEIIYVQHADSTPMRDWQRCDVVNSDNLSDDESREIRRSGGKRCAST